MKNGGILGSSKGAEEACAAIGWTVKTIDGAGSVDGCTAAFGQVLALKPNGIIVNGFDPGNGYQNEYKKIWGKM